MNLKLYLDCTSGQVQPRPTQPDPENWVGSGWSSQANGLGLDCTSVRVQPEPTRPEPGNRVGSVWSS